MNFRAFISANLLLTVLVLPFGPSLGARDTEPSGSESAGITPAVVRPATAQTQTSAAAKKCPATSSPNEIEAYLLRAIHNTPEPCPDKWIEQNDPSFGSWNSRGSYNLPVAAATVGLYRFPTRT